MNEIQRYLAEEIALDCGQGQFSRSEALRRLSVMGVSAAVAIALLAACGGGEDNAAATDRMASTSDDSASPATAPGGSTAPGTTPAPGATPPSGASPSGEQGNGTPALAPPAGTPAPGATPGPAPAPEAMTPPVSVPGDLAAVTGPGMGLPTEAITFAGPNGPLQGAFASAPEPRGAVLVIHENRGLNDHTRTVVGRFAAAGYAAIALDLLSEEGGTDALLAIDPAEPTAALGRAAASGRFVTDMQACLDELERRVPNAKIGAVGFCFGGGMMWQLIATKDPRLAAAAPFYGQLPAGADFSGASTAVLAFYGENDTRINATRDLAETALTAAGLTHELVTEPGANHAFFNDTGANYNAAAATDAWARVLAWFGEHLS